MKVLVIDDEQDIRLVAEMGLRAAGFDVVVAGDGAEGVARARADQPDIVLLDVMMPEMDGYAVCDALLADPATSGIPVVFLTARYPGTRIVGPAPYADIPVIAKPFSPRDLAARVRAMLDGR
jgi:two-component system alkaline phosphatase synthesis response regulator PhoP